MEQAVEVTDALHRLFSAVGFNQQVTIFRRDQPPGGEPLVDIPLPATPEGVAWGGKQHQGNRRGAACLDEGE